MMNRWVEKDKLKDFAVNEGFGLAVFSPLYQGLLTDRYLEGIPADSRIGKGSTWIKNELNEGMIIKLNKLNHIAKERGQKLSQMALSWVLRDGIVTTVLIGASSPAQIADNVEAAYRTGFTQEELKAIEDVLQN